MQTGRIRRAFLASALTFFCLGCHVTSERFIVGTYRAEAPCVTITLVLNRDHSFVQSARTTSGETKQLTGKWNIDQWAQGVKTVDFDAFLDFHEDYHGLEGGLGETGFIPERWPRGVLMGPIIVQCPDSGYKIDYLK
jgi:hypothetical protein